MVFSLRDSDRELVHAVSRQCVYHHPPLGAVFVLPPCWLALLPVPNCVGSGLKWKRGCFYSRGSSSGSLCLHLFYEFTLFPTRAPTWCPRGRPFPSQQRGQPRRWGLTEEIWPWHWCPGPRTQVALAYTHTYIWLRNRLVSEGWFSVHLQVPDAIVLVAAALLAGALWPRAFCACSDTTWTDSDAMNRKGYQARRGFTLCTLKSNTFSAFLQRIQNICKMYFGICQSFSGSCLTRSGGECCRVWVLLLSLFVFRFLWSDWGLVWCCLLLSSGGAPGRALSGCLGPEEDWGARLCVLRVLDPPNAWAVLFTLVDRCTEAGLLEAVCGDLAWPAGGWCLRAKVRVHLSSVSL